MIWIIVGAAVVVIFVIFWFATDSEFHSCKDCRHHIHAVFSYRTHTTRDYCEINNETLHISYDKEGIPKQYEQPLNIKCPIGTTCPKNETKCDHKTYCGHCLK